MDSEESEKSIESENDNLRKYVEQIWGKYDTDNSGTLDKQETRQFIQNTMNEMGTKISFNEAEFNRYF